jgi:Pentapeptide repeats (8 copies)
VWEQVLTRERMSNAHPEGVNLAPSPAGHLLACSTGTSPVTVFDAATGQPVRQFDGHSQKVTGLDWIDDEWLVSASMDATLQVWRPDDPVSAIVVETIAAAGLVLVPERRTALIWSARGELLAWSLAGTPTQRWDRSPPARDVAAYFTRPAVSAVTGLLALVDAGSTELLLVNDWDRVDSGPPATTTYVNASTRNSRRTNQATIDAARDNAQLTLEATREAQFADRYSRALEQLGSDNLDVRSGGIYALESIALDSPKYHPTVMEVLTAFIREHSRTTAGETRPERWPLPDVQTALTVKGRRKAEHDIRAMGLAMTDLRSAHLRGMNLTGADLRSADLSSADLVFADSPTRTSRPRTSTTQTSATRPSPTRTSGARTSTLWTSAERISPARI